MLLSSGNAYAATYGINASESDANGNEIYTDGVIKGFVNAMYAKNNNTATFTLSDISITSNNAALYATSGGKIVLGDEGTKKITINSKYNGIFSSGASNVTLTGEEITINNQAPTDYGNSYAVYNNGSGTVTLNGKTISITADSPQGLSKGIWNYSTGQTIIGDETTENITINTSSSGNKEFYGMQASNGILKATAKNINLTTNAENGQASSLYTTNAANINLSADNISINSTGKSNINAISASSKNSTITINANNIISLEATSNSNNANAIQANYGTVNVEGSTIKLNTTTEGAEKNALATSINAKYGANVALTADNVDMVTTTNNAGQAIGIYTSDNDSYKDTNVTVNADNIKLTANADNGSLASATLAAGQTQINLGDEKTQSIQLSANSEAGQAWAVAAQTNGGTESGTINIKGNNIGISANAGDSARSVNAANGAKINIGDENSVVNITASSKDEAIGLSSIEHSQLNVDGQTLVVNVTSESNDAVGIHVQNNSTTDDENFATLNVNTDNTIINARTALSAMSQGHLILNSNLYTDSDNAITARGNAVVRINEDGAHTTQLNGDINFNYDGDTSGTDVDAYLVINLNGENSYWNGNSKVTWSANAGNESNITDETLKVTGLNLQLNNGAQWNPVAIDEEGTVGTDASGTKYTAMNNLTLNNGVVDLKNLDNQQLKIEKIDGNNGTVNVYSLKKNQVSIESKDTDTQLNINGDSNIADQIYNDSNKATELAQTVLTNDNKTIADTITTDEGIISGSIFANVNPDGTISNIVKNANTTNLAISDISSIALMTWRAENDDMNKRLGELRDSRGEHGIWARMTRGESEYHSITNQYNSYQLGYDEKLSTNPNWTLGAALTYTDAESSFNKGNAENKHKGFAVYGSYLGDDGSFVDLIAKYARLEHDFDVNSGVGSGDYNTNGYSFSAEYGKRFNQDNGIWIEPQIQLTYGKIAAVNYQTKYANVYQDGMESLVGRLGFTLGKNIKAGNVYLRASYLYDFDGETEVKMSNDTAGSATYEQDLGGGWWEVGLGANINLSNASHLYFDVEKTYGGDITTPWQWNAGVRWSF